MSEKRSLYGVVASSRFDKALSSLTPWTEPGVPMTARYRHTHWIGHMRGKHSDGVFDINAIGNGGITAGWVSRKDWASMLVPWLLEQVAPRNNGKWHVTHAIEVERPAHSSQEKQHDA